MAAVAGLLLFVVGADVTANPACPIMPWTDCGMHAVSWSWPVMWAGLALTLAATLALVVPAGAWAWATWAALAAASGAFAWGTFHGLTPECSVTGSCLQYADPAGLVARSAGLVLVLLGAIACLVASAWRPSTRAFVLAGLLVAGAGVVSVIGGSDFDYACGPHYVPGATHGETTLGCLHNPNAGVAHLIAGVLAALAAVAVGLELWTRRRRLRQARAVPASGSRG